ncbi:MAG: DUF3179 domain-containing protein [Fimbriimonadaceae bacterium]|nr:DUF3179 domain-containing protein [Alphaproteobacteria bacterium]
MVITRYIRRRFPFLLLLLITTNLLAPDAEANPAEWRNQGWSQTDFSRSNIDLSQIMSGGPPKDGIPAIDNPQFLGAREEQAVAATEPVVSLKIEGIARAYPLRILMWHEIVNDEIGGTPVTITYCPLCNSAIAFDRRVAGQILDFGTTGKLRNSDLVMYDRQTQSWWQQFTGTAIVGEMTGTELKMIPVRLESFERFANANPEGQVLQPSPRHSRSYGLNPYAGYDSANGPYPFLFNGELPDDINPMARVVAVRENNRNQAVALSFLREEKIIRLGDITFTWIAGQNSALDTRIIAEGRDVGNVVVQRITAQGPVDIVHDITFAFVFRTFHPGAKIIQN